MAIDRRFIDNIETKWLSVSNTNDTDVFAAPGTGKYWAITSFIVSNSSATDTSIVLGVEGAIGVTQWITLPAPANGGHSVTFPIPFPIKGDVTKKIRVKAADAVSSLSVSVSAVKIDII